LRTNVGQLEFRGSTLVLQTNSQPRADALRRAVEARLGLFARFVGRKIDPLPPIRKPGGGQLAVDSQPVSAWLKPPPALIHELQLRHWRHTPNEKLDGQTPCEAAANAASRRKLHALLRELEHGTQDDDGRAAFAQLRNELGLDEIGERISAKQRVEVKISGRLLEFSMPLLMCSDDAAQGEAIMRVAAEVWSFVGQFGEDAVDRTELLDTAYGALIGHGLEVEDQRVKAWVNTLIPWRKLYDDPRLAQIISVDRHADRFDIIAASLSHR
jgi:hypothetical protein